MQRFYPWLKPTLIKGEETGHRQASWLELFFDLCFVLAIATLSHNLIHRPDLHGIISYFLLFLPVFWIWMACTWHASFFDNDDLFFRIFFSHQIFFSLLLTVSIPDLEKGHHQFFSWVLAAMFLTLTLMDLRVFLEKKTTTRKSEKKMSLTAKEGKNVKQEAQKTILYEEQISSRQRHSARKNSLNIGWQVLEERSPEKVFPLLKGVGELGAGIAFLVAGFLVSPLSYSLWAAGLVFSIVFIILAEKLSKPSIPIHIGHIAERYGLFVIITLGETVAAIVSALKGNSSPKMIFMAWLGFLGASAIWWLYFGVDYSKALQKRKRSGFIWGYGHYFIFAAIGAMGAGLYLTLKAVPTETQRMVDIGDMGGLILSLSTALALFGLAVLRYIGQRNILDMVFILRLLCGLALVFLAILGAQMKPACFLASYVVILVFFALYDTYRVGKRKGLHFGEL